MSEQSPDVDPVRHPTAWVARLTEEQRRAVLATFLTEDGRLRTIPGKYTARLVVLDLLAQEFEPGLRYSEADVNAALRAYHPEVAALRRYLVEAGFCARAGGHYWRTGGSVPGGPA